MVKNIFILNENLKVVKALTTDGQNTFFDDMYSVDFETGADSYEFSTNISDDIQEGYYVMFRYQEMYKLFQIIDIEQLHDEEDIITTCYSESACLELLNSCVRGLGGDGGEMSALSLFQYILNGTRWEVGEYSSSLETNIQNVKVDKTTPIWTVIQNFQSVFGYEICPRVEYNGGQITGFFIDIYDNGEMGNKTYKRFEYGRNIKGITKKKDLYDWCTAIIIDANCDVGSVSIDASTGYYKGEGSDTILALTENQTYNANKDYIYGVYEGDEVDGQEAVDNALKALKERAIPHFDYEVSSALTYEEFMELGIGDTVHVIDQSYNPALLLEARVGKLDISFTNRNNCTCSLTNYKQLKSNIREFNDLFDGVKKLTEADILAIRKFLADLDIQDAEIDRIIKALIDSMEDGVEIDTPSNPPKDDETKDDEVIGDVEDTEDYKKIILHNAQDGLFIGDKRIYDIKKQGVVATTISTEEAASDDSKAAQQYKDALAYYKKFSLGTYKNNSTLAEIMSNGNKYKIPYLVRHWCGKFGLDTRLVYAMIMAESSGNPYCNGAAYGLMQCEKSCYYGVKQTIKFLDGTTRTFTPSDNTMNPSKGMTVTINGVKANQNISNQIMFGCHEIRKCAEACHFNVFATLMGYNMGMGGVYWCTTHYIKDKYGIAYYGGNSYRGLAKQSSAMKTKYYAVLDSYKAPFASYRQKYKNQFGESTATNIEWYLRWYKPYKGSLPYFKDKKGNKLGYGAIVPSGAMEESDPTASEIRQTIVDMAKKIVYQHTKEKIATYNQSYRTVNFDKPRRYPGTKSGIKNPICYDCSSLVSCAYLKAGLNSVYNKSCAAGTLVTSATSKSGYKMWKCDEAGIEEAIPGDLIMGTNYTVTKSNCKPSNWTAYKRTHHVMVYIGKVDGVPMIAHASGYPMTWPQALRIDTLKSRSDYKNNKMFFLRPWDLAKKDAEAPTTKATTPIKETTVAEVTVKGLPGATPSDYDDLINDLTIDGKQDKTKFPSKVNYVFCHFGVGSLDDTTGYINLLKALQKKYPKKPIFVCREYHVNSSYPNAAEINAQIDTFNQKMKNYCNQTKYVISLNITNDTIVDKSTNTILSSVSSDGWSFKDKASVKLYYECAKKYILNISKGQKVKPTSTDVNCTLITQKIYKYQNPVKKFVLKLPSKVEDDYYGRLIFRTDASSIKFTQPSTLYLQGDDCKKGAFTPKKANKYVINIWKNVDTDLTTKAYCGSVTSLYTSKTVKQTGQVNCTSALNVRKGAGTSYKILGTLKNNTTVTLVSKTSNNWYKIPYKNGYGYVSGKYIDNIKDVTDTTTNFTNYANFKYRDTLVKNAESFYAKRANFVYNNTCAFDFSDPSANIDKWMTGGKYHIDDNFLMQLLVMGYSYDTADLKNQTSRKKNSSASWALPYISSEAKMARYFVEQGWVLDDVDYTNYSNLEPGDILFWDVDDINNNEFMACSHTSIVVGKDSNKNVLMIEGHSTDGVIRKVTVKTRSADSLLFVGRINLSK